jgi:uncharacterized membrane protein
MKKTYSAAIAMALLILTSCTQVNSTGEKTITQGEDTVSDVNISLSKMDVVEELSNVKEEESTELLFKASGTEPGWSAEFYKDRIFIVADYGTDKITIKRNNIDLDQKTDLKIDIGSSVVDCITIENKSCTNAAGEKESRSVKLVYGGKLYTGCGSFKK